MTVNDIRIRIVQRKSAAQKVCKKRIDITVKEIEDAVLRAQSVAYHSFNEPNSATVENNNERLQCSELAYSGHQQIKACTLIQRNFRGFLTRWRVWNFAEGLICLLALLTDAHVMAFETLSCICSKICVTAE